MALLHQLQSVVPTTVSMSDIHCSGRLSLMEVAKGCSSEFQKNLYQKVLNRSGTARKRSGFLVSTRKPINGCVDRIVKFGRETPAGLDFERLSASLHPLLETEFR